jgi:gamma-glutamylcyclotransferase (GGCT)/AIG2-like uncharacterized protein YtfP
MRHYFAYGSNMDRAHMARLCPQAEALGVASIDHHRFFIAHGGYGSIARKRGAKVYGVLWRISARDLLALDRYEEIGDGLYQHAVLPVHFDDKLLRGLVYVANDARPARPRPEYRNLVLAAARDWTLPQVYLAELEREMMLP